MRQLLNILYVTTPDAYLSLDGENVVVSKKEETLGRIPLHNLQGIVAFGYVGASPALMGACVKRNIALTFLTMHGRFLARATGGDQWKCTAPKGAVPGFRQGRRKFTVCKTFYQRQVVQCPLEHRAHQEGLCHAA